MMKKLIIASTLLLTSLVSNAQSAIPIVPGAYSLVGRMNDPFVFCTEGMPLQHGWKAVNGLTGTWVCLWWGWRGCKANLQYIPVFKTICPRALSMGPWMGPGMGSAFKGGVLTTPVSPPIVPFVH